MNPAHWHLLLNHVPVIGMMIGVLLLLWAILRSSEELKKTSLGVLVIAAAFAIPAYLTGEPAEEVAEHLPGVTHALIERHEDFAKIALVVAGLTGLIALVAWLFQHRAKWLVPMTLVFGLVATGLLGYAANLGGQIRHTEIRANATAVGEAMTTEGQKSSEKKKENDH